ncbi:MAG: iron-sulfur cluster assembly protein IscA [Betaproteobacteria bacterium RBG_16_56_24]|nr:MAG: iron-sulfur cluster assembly protein IscA [Betaproteobacteria bacterium RBG_16_56_24]
MAITMTESAAKHIRNQVEKSGNGVGLRLGVKQSGCSGFAYTFDIAQEVLETDMAFENFGAKLLVDAQHLPYLEGSELDYVKQGLGHVFKFNNPNVKNQCGCGESFAV